MEEKIVKTKILIVDDEHGIVDMIQSYFQKQYDILTAYSGQEELQKIAPLLISKCNFLMDILRL